MEGSTVADPGVGPGGPGFPLFLDQTEAPRAKKNFVETAPPLSHDLDDCPPPAPLSQGLDLAMVYLEDTTRGY